MSKKRVSKERPSRRPRAPRKKGRGRALGWTLGVAGGLLALGMVAMFGVYPRTRSSTPAERPTLRTLSFAPGVSTEEAAERLAAAGLLDDPQLFRAYLRLSRLELAAGDHALPAGLSHGELASRLARRGARAKVVLPEGLTRFDIANRLAAAEICERTAFVQASHDPELLTTLRLGGDSAEGFLFPATYELPKNSDPRKVVERLVAEFEKRFAEVEQKHAAGLLDLRNTLNFNTFELVTLASIVEREAAVAEERPIIASVFLNRLRDPSFPRHVLQSDPTSGYGCRRSLELGAPSLAACAEYAGKVTPAMNQDANNVYSTYTHSGLPPGPIANPGRASLEAVLAPASTRYFYFVAKGQGRHAFAETFEEHKKNVGR